MSKIELNLDPGPEPKRPKPTLTEILNSDHVGVEFYVHNPHSTAPSMYFMFDSREEADETAAKTADATVFVREVSEWRIAP